MPYYGRPLNSTMNVLQLSTGPEKGDTKLAVLQKRYVYCYFV